MNKKILAILMALLMVLMGSVAFALEPAPAGSSTITVSKDYTGVNGFVPAETLAFEIVFDSFEPADTTGTTVNAGNAPACTAASIPAKDGESTIAITTPSQFPAAGTYYYTMTETEGSVQGVTYGEEEIKFALLVGYDADGDYELQDVAVVKNNGEKVDTITNTYEVGSVVIDKNVTGNAGDVTDTFNAVVTITSTGDLDLPAEFTFTYSDCENKEAVSVTVTPSENTYTFNVTLKHDTDVVINNLPKGATVSVVEDDEKVGTGETQYKSTVGDAVQAGPDAKITVTNERNTELVDTGIDTDSMPYIMLMAFVMMLAAAVVLKKRTVND